MKPGIVLAGVLALLTGGAFIPSSRPKNAEITGKTYNWLVPEVQPARNRLYSSAYMRRTVEKAFDDALNAKGLVRNAEAPELLMQFHTYTNVVRRNYYGGMGGFYPWRGWGYPYWGAGPVYTTTGTKGTLVLDVKDAATGEIIWQNAVTTELGDAGNLRKQVNRSVKKLMRRFPLEKS